MAKAEYHPGALTTQSGGLKHDEAPPMSNRDVVQDKGPVLYDAQERPIYRRIGFSPRVKECRGA